MTDKTEKIIQDIINKLNKNKLTDQELLEVYCGLGTSIGAAMAGIDEDNMPSLEELERRYMTNPTPGEALFLQSLLLGSWKDE